MSSRPPPIEKFCFSLCPHCSAGLAPLTATLRVCPTCAANQSTGTMAQKTRHLLSNWTLEKPYGLYVPAWKHLLRACKISKKYPLPLHVLRRPAWSDAVARNDAARSLGTRSPCWWGGGTTPSVAQKQSVQALAVEDWQQDNPCYLCWGVGHTAKAHSARWDSDMSGRWERNTKAWNGVKHMSGPGMSPEAIAPVLNATCPPMCARAYPKRDCLIAIAREYAPYVPMDD